MSTDHPFRRALAVVLEHEGGLSEDPSDPGGITRYGISLRAYPGLGAEGIRNLTVEQAAEIYRRDWWERYGYDRLPELLAVKVFDLAVNIGPNPAHRLLQRALVACGQRVTVDGILGPQTVAAAHRVDVERCLRELRAEAVMHYLSLCEENAGLRRFLRGWIRRAVW